MIDGRNPVELAQALIRCKSVTPDEGGALALIEDVLKKAGFDVNRPVFKAPGTPDVENLYARIGTEAPVFVFAGHIDVVPSGDEAAWSHKPFGGDINEGVLYGRGAVDMKGGVAAMIAAALRHLPKKTKGSIAFLITGDEEGPALNGTSKLLAWARERGETFDHCVLGEPSSTGTLGDEIKIGRRGSLNGVLTVHGKQGHVAYPEKAENPIRNLLPMLDSLLAPLDFGSIHFQRSNLEITSVDVGNQTTNLIPSKAVARFNVRFGDAHTLDSLQALLRERLERAADGTRYELEFVTGASASFITEPGKFVDLVAAAVEEETGTRPKLSTAGGTSDARFIKDHCPVVELGLVNTTMHQVDERVPVEELEAVTRIYERVLERYFAQ